jgi:hypothetical protein
VNDLGADISTEIAAVRNLEECCERIHELGGQLYVLVDEYDRFANRLLLEGSSLAPRIDTNPHFF